MTQLSTPPAPLLKPMLPQARILDERREGIYTVFQVQVPGGQIVLRSNGWTTEHRGRGGHATETRLFVLFLTPAGLKGSCARATVYKLRKGQAFQFELKAGVAEYSSMTRAIEVLALEWAQQFPDAVVPDEGVA